MLFMQGVIAAFLLLLAWFSRDDLRSLVVMLGTLVVPAGWSYATWSAWKREESARREGRFDAAFGKKERARGAAVMGASVGAWILVVVLAFVFL